MSRRKAKQSWPLFWIFGFLGSCFLIFMGIYLIIVFTQETNKDSGMLYCGIFMLLMGIGLLAGVIVTFCTLVTGGGKDPHDFSITVGIDQALGKKKYSAEKLVRNVSYGRNNVATINTGDGFFRFYGYNGRFIAEIRIVSGEDFRTYHLTVPNQTDDSATVLTTIFERFPTRKNRIVSNATVVSAVQKLYGTRRLDQMIYDLSCVDSTAETRNLIRIDAYITPQVPIAIVNPTSEEGKRRTEREEAAMRELQNTNRAKS